MLGEYQKLVYLLTCSPDTKMITIYENAEYTILVWHQNVSRHKNGNWIPKG